jgi:hypothetical protein
MCVTRVRSAHRMKNDQYGEEEIEFTTGEKRPCPGSVSTIVAEMKINVKTILAAGKLFEVFICDISRTPSRSTGHFYE